MAFNTSDFEPLPTPSSGGNFNYSDFQAANTTDLPSLASQPPSSDKMVSGFWDKVGLGVKQSFGMAPGGYVGSVPNPVKMAGQIAEPAMKGLATGARSLQATPDILSGNLAGANQTMQKPLLGQKTLAGSTNLQNLGSAANAASSLVGIKGSLPAIAGGAPANAALFGAVQGGLGNTGSYLSQTDKPTVKGTLSAAGQGVISGAATGYGAAKLQPLFTTENPVEQAVSKGIDKVSNAAGAIKNAVEAPIKSFKNSISPDSESALIKAIKPGKNNTGFVNDLRKALPVIQDTEATAGKNITDLQSLSDAITATKQRVWADYEKLLGPNADATIDGNQIADAMNATLDKRFITQNQAKAESIQALADTYRKPISLADAEEFLQSANNELNTYYAKSKVGQGIAANDPEKGYVVAEADALRNALYSKLDDLTGANSADIKQTYGALSNVQKELIGRMNVDARSAPVSLAQQISRMSGAGDVIKGLTHLDPGMVGSGVGKVMLGDKMRQLNDSDYLISSAFDKLREASQSQTGYNAEDVLPGGKTGIAPLEIPKPPKGPAGETGLPVKDITQMTPEELAQMRANVTKAGGALPGSAQAQAGADTTRPFNERQMEIAAQKGDVPTVQKLLVGIPKTSTLQHYLQAAQDNANQQGQVKGESITAPPMQPIPQTDKTKLTLRPDLSRLRNQQGMPIYDIYGRPLFDSNGNMVNPDTGQQLPVYAPSSKPTYGDTGNPTKYDFMGYPLDEEGKLSNLPRNLAKGQPPITSFSQLGEAIKNQFLTGPALTESQKREYSSVYSKTGTIIDKMTNKVVPRDNATIDLYNYRNLFMDNNPTYSQGDYTKMGKQMLLDKAKAMGSESNASKIVSKLFGTQAGSNMQQYIRGKNPLMDNLVGQVQRDIAFQVYPFTDQAKKDLSNNVIIRSQDTQNAEDAGNEGQTTLGPVPINKESINIKPENLFDPSAFLTSGSPVTTAMDPMSTAHEYMHAYLDHALRNGDLNEGTMAQFNQAWDDIVKKASSTNAISQSSKPNPTLATLKSIDGIIDNSPVYQDAKGDPNHISEERFAYLGEMYGIGGLNAFPRALRPYYAPLFKSIPAEKYPPVPAGKNNLVPATPKIQFIK